MNKRNISVIIVTIILIIVIIIILKMKNIHFVDKEINSNENVIEEFEKNEENFEQNNGIINIDINALKNSVEKEENGIMISNVTITENKDNLVTIGMNVKNNNNDKKMVSVGIIFYNEKKEEIGRNQISMELEKNEKKEMINTSYVSEDTVYEYDLEVEIQDVPTSQTAPNYKLVPNEKSFDINKE